MQILTWKVTVIYGIALTISPAVDESATEQQGEAVKEAEAEWRGGMYGAHNCDAIVHQPFHSCQNLQHSQYCRKRHARHKSPPVEQ